MKNYVVTPFTNRRLPPMVPSGEYCTRLTIFMQIEKKLHTAGFVKIYSTAAARGIMEF